MNDQTYIRATIIVPADSVEMFRSIAASLSPSGEGMFVVPLYTGADLTHYISTGMIWQIFADTISSPELFSQATGTSLQEALAIQGAITYLAIGDSDGEEPVLHNRDAIAHLGLSLSPQVEDEGETEEEE